MKKIITKEMDKMIDKSVDNFTLINPVVTELFADNKRLRDENKRLKDDLQDLDIQLSQKRHLAPPNEAEVEHLKKTVEGLKKIILLSINLGREP